MKLVVSVLTIVKKIDIHLEKIFKNVQHLSDQNRELIVQSWPTMALVFGAIQAYWAWVLWGFTRYTFPDPEFYNNIYASYPDVLNGAERFAFYLGIAILVLEAVILLMAYNGLKARARRGWDLLFVAMLLNTASAVASLFISRRGMASFVFGMLSSVIGFYLLYEIRGKYGFIKSTKSKSMHKNKS